MKSTFFQQSTMRDWFSKTTTIIILLLIFQIPRIDVIFFMPSFRLVTLLDKELRGKKYII